jgi:cytochrome c oxidase subunit 4
LHHEAVWLDTNQFGSTFFLLTGFHGAHVTVGAVWLLSLWMYSLKKGMPLLALRRRRLDRDLHRGLSRADGAQAVARPTARDSAADGGTMAVQHESLAQSDAHHLAHDEHAHPTAKVYIQIAIVLTIITAVEVFVLYLPEMGLEVSGKVLVTIFAVLSLTKFLLVVGWYMHLKFDPPMYRRIFGFALVVALTVATAFIALFHGMYPS